MITSCGQCKLGLKGKPGCSLTIKIGESIYPVEGTGIHDHGDAHGREGFCSAIRVAWATGKIKDKVFHAESFELVGEYGIIVLDSNKLHFYFVTGKLGFSPYRTEPIPERHGFFFLI